MLTREEIPGLICAALLLGAGIVVGIWHWRHWIRQVAHQEADLELLWDRYRRRIRVAVLIAVEGLLLATVDTALPLLKRAEQITERQMAMSWAWLVLLMLLVAVWIALLAFGDLAITASKSRMERLHMRQEQRALREEIERYRNSRDDADS